MFYIIGYLIGIVCIVAVVAAVVAKLTDWEEDPDRKIGEPVFPPRKFFRGGKYEFVKPEKLNNNKQYQKSTKLGFPGELCDTPFERQERKKVEQRKIHRRQVFVDASGNPLDGFGDPLTDCKESVSTDNNGGNVVDTERVGLPQETGEVAAENLPDKRRMSNWKVLPPQRCYDLASELSEAYKQCLAQSKNITGEVVDSQGSGEVLMGTLFTTLRKSYCSSTCIGYWWEKERIGCECGGLEAYFAGKVAHADAPNII